MPELLALTGFLVLYLAFALVITKAPNYTRLLVILPFVVYLAGTGLWWLADLVSRGRPRTMRVLVSCGVAVIVVLNVRIFRDFVSTRDRERGWCRQHRPLPGSAAQRDWARVDTRGRFNRPILRLGEQVAVGDVVRFLCRPAAARARDSRRTASCRSM